MASSAQNRKGKGKAPPPPVVPEVPLGKQLAHTDKAVRDAAVRNLSAYLSRGSEEADGAEGSMENGSTFTQLNDGEMAKLWKGLFYCFWMSDKPLIQQALAADLAELILSINPKITSTSHHSPDARNQAALGYLRGFWECICREWPGIDRLRMDKFYMLIRRFVNATFRLLQRSGWKIEIIDTVNRILQGEPAQGKSKGRAGPLDYTNPRIPISLSTHLSDLYMTELNRVLSSTPSSPSSSSSTLCPLISLLEPFSTLAARTPTPVVYTRLMDTLFLPLLRALTTAAGTVEEAPSSKKRRTANGAAVDGVEGYEAIVESCGPAGAAAQKAAVLKSLFSAAADEGAKEANRRKVYIVWNEMGGADEDAEEDW